MLIFCERSKAGGNRSLRTIESFVSIAKVGTFGSYKFPLFNVMVTCVTISVLATGVAASKEQQLGRQGKKHGITDSQASSKSILRIIIALLPLE